MYNSIREYYQSDEYRRVRRKLLNKTKGVCESCGVHRRLIVRVRAREVGGTEEILLPRGRRDFVVVCSDCWGLSGKQALPLTGFRTLQRLQERGYDPCEVCHKNPTKVGKDLCGKCARLVVPSCEDQESIEAQNAGIASLSGQP